MVYVLFPAEQVQSRVWAAVSLPRRRGGKHFPPYGEYSTAEVVQNAFEGEEPPAETLRSSCKRSRTPRQSAVIAMRPERTANQRWRNIWHEDASYCCLAHRADGVAR